MKLRHAGRTYNVIRRSENTFDVDGVRVGAEVPTSRRRVFVARDGDRVWAQIDGRSYQLTVVKRDASTATEASAAQGGLEAPMPGRVTRVAVAVGETVKRGQELIVVEAMKMENALVAPGDGVVKSLAVKEGDMVTPGPALIVIEIEMKAQP